MFNNDTWFDPAYARSTFRPITNNALDLGTTALYWSKAYINQVHGASTLGLGIAGTVGYSLAANSTLSFTDSNSRIQADTSDGSDNKAFYVCGGGSNITSRGAVIFIGGNEYSGYNGLLSLSSGNASSAYVAITAPSATSPTIRFTLTSSEQWRMSGVDLVGYDTALAYNQITRVDNLGRLILCGGTNSSSSNGASLSLGGATYGGTVGLIAGNVSTGHLTYHAPHASARHMFLIASTEQWRMSGTSIIGYDTSGNKISRVNDTGVLQLAGGTSTSTSNGAVIELYGISHGAVGALVLYTGNNSSGHLQYQVSHASALHRFFIGGTENLRLSPTAITGMNSASTSWLRTNDTGYAVFGAGSAAAAANGAMMYAYGNSHASNPGRLYFYSGTGSGLMIFEMGLSTGAFRFRNASAVSLLDISDTQFYCNVPTDGDHSWRVNGTQLMNLSASGLRLPSLTDAAAGNDTWYYSTTQSKACYKNSAGTVNVLY